MDGDLKEITEPCLKKAKIFVHNYGKTLNKIPYRCWYSRPEKPDYFKAMIKAII